MEKKYYTINAFGETHRVRCEAHQYCDRSLAIVVIEDNGEEFGVLTVNLMSTLTSDKCAFVKTYSENEGWARELANKIGTDTGITQPCGYVDVPLYIFDLDKF